MRVYSTIEAFLEEGKQPLVLTLGNFDGVHQGHQKILERCRKRADLLGIKAAVFTFQNHPQSILHPKAGPKLLTSNEQKLYFLQQNGADICFSIAFTEKFSEIKAEDFVKDILVKKLGVRYVCLGYNARFGHNRLGDTQTMTDWARKLGFGFEQVDGVIGQDDYISSSRIRAYVEQGNLEKAAQFLGRPFGFFSKVVQGDRRGRGLGFPTANLDTSRFVMPPAGVYPVKVRKIKTTDCLTQSEKFDYTFETAGFWHNGVLNYGTRPTFHPDSAPKIAECLILDFQGELYGESLELHLYPKIRDEKHFESAEALKNQISEDIATSIRALSCVNY